MMCEIDFFIGRLIFLTFRKKQVGAILCETHKNYKKNNIKLMKIASDLQVTYKNLPKIIITPDN